MDWTNVRFLPVFHIVLTLWLRAALALVEPPANVTFHCRNLHNTLKWDYNQFIPGLKFKVDIRSMLSSPAVLWVDPPHQHADLSLRSNPEDVYFVQLTAVTGDGESESVPPEGIIFSYFKNSPGLNTQKCFLDLPPVNVTAQQDAKVLFRFMHPWLFYSNELSQIDSNQKRRKKKSSDHEPEIEELPEFEYTVTMEERRHNFICVDSVCEEMLPVDAKQEEHCLTITGELQKMTVKATQLYCATQFTEKSNNTIYIVISLLAVGVAVFFVLGMVYRKKTKPSVPFPLPINSFKQNVRQTFNPRREEVAVPGVEPTTPTPLLSGETETKGEDESSSTVIHDTFVCRRSERSAEDEGVCDDIEGGQLDNEGSGYMGGKVMEEDETQSSNEVSSGYEKRDVIFDNLAPDDQAKGYRG